jgi:hypothetical protein
LNADSLEIAPGDLYPDNLAIAPGDRQPDSVAMAPGATGPESRLIAPGDTGPESLAITATSPLGRSAALGNADVILSRAAAALVPPLKIADKNNNPMSGPPTIQTGIHAAVIVVSPEYWAGTSVRRMRSRCCRAFHLKA